MNSWLEKYKDRITTPDGAASVIQSGQNLVLGHAAAAPQFIPEAMMAQKERLKDVNIYHMVTLHPAVYMQPEGYGHFRHVTNFAAGNTRDGINDDRGDFFPYYYHEIPNFFDTKYPVDVALITVSYPNEEGYCSLGISVDYTKPATDRAKIVIAEMNDKMPFLGYGDCLIHISKIDHIVPTSKPMFELPLPKIGPVEEKIGEYCASLIEDGSTLQLGIGAIPDAVLHFLGDKKDLGIHTEMFSDGVVDLVKKGVINNSKKKLHPGKLVSGFLMGSQKLYDFVDNNPDVLMYPVNYVNDPRTICQMDKFVSINSALEIDLQGQSTAESIGLKVFSGTGGQVDFIRGAAWSKGGKAILAFPSTAKHGEVSRIKAYLTEGAGITTPRDDVDYIVTEYGIAHLKGATLKERARMLINIAHPKFRDELIKEFERRFHRTKF
ncbi:MAG: acetyl-CoA hydrolase/transferase family protein [Bacteroidales bacterium]|nr:acetyl-CoA hydrolase/transferase family protein [Bacteroidales bacterium]